MSLSKENVRSILEYKKRMHRVIIDTALKQTLRTVKFSSNLFPVNIALQNYDDEKIYFPTDKESMTWSFFAVNRVTSATPFGDDFLVSTWVKSKIKPNFWSPALKVTSDSNFFTISNKVKKEYKLLSDIEKKYIQNQLLARQGRVGNCGVLVHYLLDRVWRVLLCSQVDTVGKLEVIKVSADVDHVVMLFNRAKNSLISKPSTWQCTVIDPWRGIDGEIKIISSQYWSDYVTTLRKARPDIILKNVAETNVEVLFSIENPSEKIDLFNRMETIIDGMELRTLPREYGKSAHMTSLRKVHDELLALTRP